MALKCAKNDFKHSMVHRDRRNENIFGCFFGPILDQKYVYVFCQKRYGLKARIGLKPLLMGLSRAEDSKKHCTLFSKPRSENILTRRTSAAPMRS